MSTVAEQNVAAQEASAIPAVPGAESVVEHRNTLCLEWGQLVPAQEWDLYASAIESLRAADVRLLLGGAFGLAAHTGRWRNTKDIDFFILPEQRARAIDALTAAGFKDYYDTVVYDRGWIYRGTRDGVIVDLIWGTPNRRTEVDEQWFENAHPVQLRSLVLLAVPPEELVWIKLYVLQRDRCDWPDIVNLLYATSSTLNWSRLVDRFGEDVPLLHGALVVFAWICPDRIGHIPMTLRRRAGVRTPRRTSSGPDQQRVKLLDSRPWFAAFQPCDRPMQL